MTHELRAAIPDAFETEGPLQPKSAVADYVESQGILVPKRFETFEEAQFAAINGISVLARSEHPDEYSGPSGLGYTGYFELDDSGIMKPDYLTGNPDIKLHYLRYIKASGEVEPNEYLSLASESYWEAIPGLNVTCIADDAVEGRYHLFGHRYASHDGSMPNMVAGAVVEENGNIVRLSRGHERTEQIVAHARAIIDFYNSVRSLPKFNPDHCPIMEMQLGDADGQVYFLQYHRARDAAPVPQQLKPEDYDAREGWVQADAVRGAYLGEKALHLALAYKGVRNGTVNAWGMGFPEDGSASVAYDHRYLDEYLGRKRIAHLMPDSFDAVYDKIAAKHGPRSQMFKPQISVLIATRRGEDPTPVHLREPTVQAWMNNQEHRVKTEVVSDGRTGFFRFSDQLVIIDN